MYNTLSLFSVPRFLHEIDTTLNELNRDYVDIAMYRENDQYVYEFNVAGYSKDEIEVSILKDSNTLSVVAQKPEYPSRKYSYNNLNSHNKVFKVSLNRGEMSLDSADVSFKDGVLRVIFDEVKLKGRDEIKLAIK